MTDHKTTDTITLTRAQKWYVSWTADLLIYTVVLNLFDQHVEGVKIENFMLSIFTAVLLKVMLVVLAGMEHRVTSYFRAKGSTAWTAVGAMIVFAILFGGKLLILEVVNLVFGEAVELGHFVEVAALILTMMIARGLMDWTFQRLGRTATT